MRVNGNGKVVITVLQRKSVVLSLSKYNAECPMFWIAYTYINIPVNEVDSSKLFIQVLERGNSVSVSVKT